MTGLESGLLANYKAYYPSQYVPNLSDRDELALAIQAARQFNLTFRLTFGVLYKAPNSTLWVKRAYPNGTLFDYEWLDPTNPQARQHVLNLVREVVTNYDFDELTLDYIRYDDADMPYTESARQQFEEYLNETITDWPGPFAPQGERWGEFLEWRMIPINTLVKEIYDLAKSIKPKIKVGAAIRWWVGHPKWQLWTVGQDPTAWIKDGYLDVLRPMIYKPNYKDFEIAINAYMNYAVAGPEGAVPVIPYLSMHPDYNNGNPIPPENFSEQVSWIRSLGCDGFTYCAYGGEGDNPNNPDPLPDIGNYLNLVSLPKTWKLSNITLHFLNETSVKITWQTTKPATSKVEYNTSSLFNASYEYVGTVGSYPGIHYWDVNYFPGITVENTTLRTNHEILLTNLKKGILHFRVQSEDSIGIVTSRVYEFKL